MGDLVIQNGFRTISGSLFNGTALTASYWSGSITNALSSSYAITASWIKNAQTASYWSGSITNALSASQAETASWIKNSQTSSYWSGSITNALSSSYATTSSYWSGSINNTLSASYAITTSYWSGSITNALSSSFSSTSSYWSGSIINAQTASFVTTAQTASVLLFNPTYSFVSGNITTTGQALVNIAGMTIVSCSINSIYEFEANLFVGTSAVITGTKYGVAFNAAGASLTYQIIGTRFQYSASFQEPMFTGSLASSGSYLMQSSVSGSVLIKGILRTSSSIGNLTVQHLKVTSGTSTIVTGSYLWAQRIV